MYPLNASAHNFSRKILLLCIKCCNQYPARAAGAQAKKRSRPRTQVSRSRAERASARAGAQSGDEMVSHLDPSTHAPPSPNLQWRPSRSPEHYVCRCCVLSVLSARSIAGHHLSTAAGCPAGRARPSSAAPAQLSCWPSPSPPSASARSCGPAPPTAPASGCGSPFRSWLAG